MINSFTDFALPEDLKLALDRMQFHEPTPIQSQAIPLALAGKDILGSAQTGTGKTAAFAIPIIAKLMDASYEGTALILTPTRELATQVKEVFTQLLRSQKSIKPVLLVGGEPIGKQIFQLKSKPTPRVIVGTPGRIIDHLERETLDLSMAGLFVIDETDRMLDLGFGPQLDAIIQYLPEVRQTLMFSATLPPNIVKLSSRHMQNPERIAAGPSHEPAADIQQDSLMLKDQDKYNALLTALQAREGHIIVFANTRYGTENLSKKLKQDGHSTDYLHGQLQQNRRDRVIRSFRNKQFRIMIATDVAARGLDISHIEHVINYDLPHCPEDYIHRIGRTARAKAKGMALSLISSKDMKYWRAIENLVQGKPDKGGQRSEGTGRGSSGGSRSRDRKPGERSRFSKGGGAPRFRDQESRQSDERAPKRFSSFSKERHSESSDRPRFSKGGAAPRFRDQDSRQSDERVPKRFSSFSKERHSESSDRPRFSKGGAAPRFRDQDSRQSDERAPKRFSSFNKERRSESSDRPRFSKGGAAPRFRDQDSRQSDERAPKRFSSFNKERRSESSDRPRFSKSGGTARFSDQSRERSRGIRSGEGRNQASGDNQNASRFSKKISFSKKRSEGKTQSKTKSNDRPFREKKRKDPSEG